MPMFIPIESQLEFNVMLSLRNLAYVIQNDMCPASEVHELMTSLANLKQENELADFVNALTKRLGVG